MLLYYIFFLTLTNSQPCTNYSHSVRCEHRGGTGGEVNPDVTNRHGCSQAKCWVLPLQEVASRLENDALGSSSGLSALKQLDKKKKTTEEAFMKANEAETTYKACVFEANHRQHELERTKVLIAYP